MDQSVAVVDYEDKDLDDFIILSLRWFEERGGGGWQGYIFITI